MADEEEVAVEDTPKKKGSGKGLMIVLVVLIVVLLLAVSIGGYFLYSKGAFSDSSQNVKQETAMVENNDNSDFFKVPINDLVLNITNSKGREKLMKLSFSLKSIEPSIEAIVEQNKAEIIDVVIQQVGARSSEELLTVGGKELLKEELLEEINMVVNEASSNNEDIKKDNIKNLYFTTFVIK